MPRLDHLYEERNRELETVDRIADVAETEDRDLSDSDRELIGRAHTRIGELDPQIEFLVAQEAHRAAHNERVPVRAAARPEPAGRPGEQLEVYRTFAQYARDTLIARYDAVASLAGPGERDNAMERLARDKEATVSRVVANTLTTDIGGLLPHDYMSTFAELIDASRPVVAAAGTRAPIVRGSVTYPSITQRPTAAKQVTEKTEGSSQKMTVAFVDVPADTFMAVGDLSWQAINWSVPNALELWFRLAAEQYARQTEAAAGTVVAAATAVATPAVVQATATLAEWIAAITGCAAAIYGAGRRRPDTIFASVDSGYQLASLVANVSPVFLAGGTFSLRTGQGNVAGLNLVISPGLAVKTMVVADSTALLVGETPGAPVELRAVEPAIGGMEVGIIGGFVAKIMDASGLRKLTIT